MSPSVFERVAVLVCLAAAIFGVGVADSKLAKAGNAILAALLIVAVANIMVTIHV